MKSVSINFSNNSTAYDYLYDLDYPVALGDYVVVDSPYNGPVTAKVVAVNPSPQKATKHVVGYVDMTAHKAREALRLKTEKLIAEIDKRVKALDKELRYQMAAKLDPEIAALLKDLKKVQS